MTRNRIVCKVCKVIRELWRDDINNTLLSLDIIRILLEDKWECS